MKALRTRTAAVTTMTLVTGGLILATAPAASADDERTKRGSCSMSSTWRLELEKDDGEIDVDFDGYTKKSDRTWRYIIKQNGDVKDRGTETTEDDGDFEIDDDLRDRSGRDTIVVRAKQPASGEVCKARLSI